MRTLSRPRWLFVVVAMLFVAAVLRVYRLDAESAWLDEAFSVGLARDGVNTILDETSKDVHPPLYYFLLRGWTLVFGGSVRAARLLSVVLSVGALAATFLVGRRLVGEAAALVAVALLTVSAFQIEFAQEARMYALLTLLATLSMGGFMRLFDPPFNRRSFAAFVIVTSAMTYTHVYAAFVIAAQGAIVLAELAWRRRRALAVLTRWAWAMALVFVAFLPWLPTFTWQVSYVQQSFWIAEPASNGWFEAFRTYAGSQMLVYLQVTLAVLGVVSLRRAAPAAGARSPLLFLLPWILGPILIPFALSFLGSSIFLPKYTIAASIPFALLVGAGIVSLPFRAARASVVVACIVLSLRTLPAYYDTQTKDGWREAVAAVEARAGRGDLVVIYPYFNAYAYNLYQQRTDVVVRPFPMYGPPPPQDGWPVTIARGTAPYDRIWFVTLAQDPTARVVIDALQTQFTPISLDVVQKIAIHRLERTH